MNVKSVVAQLVPEAQQFEAGDKVSFRGRGQMVVGTIARVRVRERRKASRLLAMHGIRDTGLTQSMVAEVSPEGGGAVWTVPFAMLTMVKKGGGDVGAARHAVAALKGDYQDRLRQRRSGRFDAADQGGLSSLKPGDSVQCQFRGGSKQVRKFRRITPSGKVEVETDYGRIEKHNPQFVTKV